MVLGGAGRVDLARREVRRSDQKRLRGRDCDWDESLRYETRPWGSGSGCVRVDQRAESLREGGS